MSTQQDFNYEKYRYLHQEYPKTLLPCCDKPSVITAALSAVLSNDASLLTFKPACID